MTTYKLQTLESLQEAAQEKIDTCKTNINAQQSIITNAFNLMEAIDTFDTLDTLIEFNEDTEMEGYLNEQVKWSSKVLLNSRDYPEEEIITAKATIKLSNELH